MIAIVAAQERSRGFRTPWLSASPCLGSDHISVDVTLLFQNSLIQVSAFSPEVENKLDPQRDSNN